MFVLPGYTPRRVPANMLVALLALATIVPLAAVEDQVANTQCFAKTAAFVASVMDRHFVACNQSAEQLGQFLQDSTNSLLAECAAGSEPLRPLSLLVQATTTTIIAQVVQPFTSATKIPVAVKGAAIAQISFYIIQAMRSTVNDSAFNISSAQYDVVLFPSNFLGDLGAAGALASLLPFIDGDVQQPGPTCLLTPPPSAADLGSRCWVCPPLEYPLLMYVNWPLLSYAYNLTRPVVGEAGQLSFYPDTWQELVAVMRHVNATASDPVTGKPRHALCIPAATDVSVVMYAVMASIMQTGGVTQGWLYDSMTLEPLTNNTAMQQVLSIMWDLSPFLRSFEAVQGEVNSEIDLSKCAITLAGPSVFKTLHPIYSNRAYMGQLTMSPLPASTEVLDRSTMQLVTCTAQLCNNKRAAMLGGQLANLSPTRYIASELVGMTSKVPPQVQATAYGLLAFLGSANVTLRLTPSSVVSLVMAPTPGSWQAAPQPLLEPTWELTTRGALGHHGLQDTVVTAFRSKAHRTMTRKNCWASLEVGRALGSTVR
ncbi:predicted protein [Haematococcus lacustris]|uniref:Guanylate cyclase domain-containing protein n=1 Tax=Haematococcus lacustris TaxID=44745 RepID=A0A699YZR0_HAELA|nr:predicted protein [Haematococcus lacustris]